METKNGRAQGKVFTTARKAIEYARAKGGQAILLNGKCMVVTRLKAKRMEEAGSQAAWLFEYNNHIVVIPPHI